MLENYNNLQYFTGEKKRTRIHTIDHTRRRLQVDVLAGTEPRTDWILAKMLGGDAYHDLFDLSKD